MVIEVKGEYQLIPKPRNLIGIKCLYCKRKMASETHHLIGQVAYRDKSEKYGLTAGLCWECHDKLHCRKGGIEIKRFLQKVAQKVFEKYIGNRQDWMKEFHKNYLWDEE